MAAPAVSIVTATYNRPDALLHAVRSALDQTFTDFELIVVGDGCDAATGEALATLDDPRLRYHNLAENFGEQSGPNNFGVQLAAAERIAFLNHDDLWWPDHLERAVARLEESGADLVFTMLDSAKPGGGGRLMGSSADGAYHPLSVAPASSWVLRRQLHEDLGGWRSARQLYNIPSQDFLFRAWRAGHRLVQLPALTVLACHSVYRKGCYLGPDHELAAFARQLREDPAGLRAQRLAVLANTASAQLEQSSPLTSTRQALRQWAKALTRLLGVHWIAFGKFFRHLRPAGHIDELRRTRGLEPLER